MNSGGPLVILGDSAFAEIAFEYFTHDSQYRVAGFSVEAAYLKSNRKFGLPVVPFEDLERYFSPSEHAVFAANVYTQRNRLRTRLYQEAKSRGYRPASYISSRAFVWPNAALGEHVFIFENNVIQPFVTIGSNTVLWSGNHIGHHSRLGSNCFVSSHVVVSGFVEVGDFVFLGVNSTVSNNVSVGTDCVVGAGALVLGDVPADTTVVGTWKHRKET